MHSLDVVILLWSLQLPLLTDRELICLSLRHTWISSHGSALMGSLRGSISDASCHLQEQRQLITELLFGFYDVF